ncbi:MAG: ATP-binding cassette domain-containing protein, partial [Desulfobacterales bacterium]
NIALPLETYTDLSPVRIRKVVELKLALVGMAGFEEFYPSEISGGIQKRAEIARAIALDPEILCIDEPSVGLSPVSARRLDDLILELRESLGTTIVVTNELASIFTIEASRFFWMPPEGPLRPRAARRRCRSKPWTQRRGCFSPTERNLKRSF